MENIDLTIQDDDDCGQFVKHGKRSRRMVISDDDDDGQDNCEVVNELVATVDKDSGDVRNTSQGDPALVPHQEALNNRGTNGIDDGAALSAGADSDSESVQYDVPGDVELQEAVMPSKLPTSTGLRLGLTSDSIFDDDISDGDSSALEPSHEDTSRDIGDDRSDDNENSSDDDDMDSKISDDSQMDSSLLAKLKRMKGASKSGQDRQKYSRKAKPTADKMLEIYSESHRLLRDSRVNLPYHEPEPKQLEDFLARAIRKKQEYAGLHRAKDIQKAQVICGRLSSSPHLMSSSNKCGPKFASSQCRSDMSTTETTAPDCQLNKPDDGHPSVHMSSSKCISKCLVSPVTVSTIDTSGPVADVGLPDLCPVSASLEGTSSSEAVCDVRSQDIQTAATETSTHDLRHNGQTHISTPIVKKDPSRDFFRSQNSMIDEPLEQPQLLQGQDSCLQIGGQAQLDCSADNMTGRRSSCEGVNVSDSPSLIETVHSRDSVHLTVADMNAGHSSIRTPVSYTSQTEPVAKGASQSLINVTPCSQVVGGVPDDSSVATPVGRASRHKLLDRLQGFSLAVSPSLSATPDGVVCLDDAEPTPVVVKPGLMKLMNRLMEHSKKNSTTEVTSSHLDERQDQVTASVLVETGESAESSGYKLDRLKQQLGVGMREKRAEARQRRYNQFALDNEQGFGEEEEEAEMESEGSDSEVDEETEKTQPSDSEEDEDDDCNINMEANDSDDDDYIPYLDKEALDDDDDDDVHEQHESSDVCLRFDVSDEEEHTLQDTEQDGEHSMKQRMREHTSNSGLCTSEEDNAQGSRETVIMPGEESASTGNHVYSGGNIVAAAAAQPDTARLVATDTARHAGTGTGTPTGVVSSLRHWSSQTSPLLKDTPQQSDFRRENSESPDLYSSRMDEQNNGSRSQPSNSADTHVLKYLDDDGFIQINETQRTSKLLLLPQIQHNDHREGNTVFETTCPMSAGHIFHGLATQDSGKGDHQIASSQLSSGSFIPCTSSNQYSQQEEHDDDVIDPFHVLSESEDDVAHTHQEKEEKVFTDSDDAESGGDDTGYQCDSTEKHRSELTHLKKKKKTFRMTDFVEDEAELSGSEYDSDENVDVAEEDDILEEEAGDLDLQGVSEEKLRDEVGRLHMKQLRDDDDRAVMRYKEMYLQDGDLYSEGAGRMRNFRWKDVDDQSQQGRFGYNSDDAQAEEEAEEDQWRKDRFEREKFLEEKDCGSETEGQVFKLGQVFLKKQESIPPTTDNVTMSSIVKSSLSQAPQLKIQRKGSFLSRGKDSLGKIAEVVQTAHAVHGGKNSRSFLFQTVDGSNDDDEKKDQSQSSRSGKRTAHHPVCTPDTAKRAKQADTSSATSRGKTCQLRPQSSIFDLFTDI